MSGHSKWSTIKRQKGANDAKRGALFTKVAREIAVAARLGGGDPDANYRLRLAVEKARSVNMPADNIKRTIEKATGGGDAEQFEEIVYEGYGPGGVAVLEAQTDNRNRSAAEVRSMFTGSGASCRRGQAWQFEPRNDHRTAYGVDADEVALAAIDAAPTTWTRDEAIETTRRRATRAGAGVAREVVPVECRSGDIAGRSNSTPSAPGAAARRAARGPDDVARDANFDIPEEVFAEVAG
jgi:YebC/PmpR family DNA-binding regulatory protein